MIYWTVATSHITPTSILLVVEPVQKVTFSNRSFYSLVVDALHSLDLSVSIYRLHNWSRSAFPTGVFYMVIEDGQSGTFSPSASGATMNIDLPVPFLAKLRPWNVEEKLGKRELDFLFNVKTSHCLQCQHPQNILVNRWSNSPFNWHRQFKKKGPV